jgi:hypothetical protein
MRQRRTVVSAVGALAAVVSTSCATASPPDGQVRLEVVGEIVEPSATADPARYALRTPTLNAWEAGAQAQSWSMLGREDRAAAAGYPEYQPAECEALGGGPSGWDNVLDAIAARAADYRIVIINESHVVTRHRETTRRLLAKLRPLGFSVLAAETFTHLLEGQSPVSVRPFVAWPRQNEGAYSDEATFGRLVRQAKELGFRLAAYEEIFDPSAAQPAGPAESIARREAAQARHLAEILGQMRPDERLIVHVGYSHAAEVRIDGSGGESDWMAARLKADTGIDPLTIAQTVCSSAGGDVRLAAMPTYVRPGQFDVIVSHPVTAFADHRPAWRLEAGDVSTPIPPSLRPTNAPLVIEAFAWGEPFEAVPVDRVFVEPGENLPLLLPPGRYRVRAVRVVQPQLSGE